MQTGGNLTRFWLDGDLKISALEQIEFLQNFIKNDLPYKQKNLDKTKDVMIVESNDNYTIKSKNWLGNEDWLVCRIY